MAKEKISAECFERHNGSVLFLDTTRIPDMDEIRDYCEANDREVPEEDSEEYWDIVRQIKESDLEIFLDNCPEIGRVVMQGSCGLWYGKAACGTVASIPDGRALVDFAFTGRGIDDCRISVDQEDGLVVSALHHDGTNSYVLRELTEEGEELFDGWEAGEIHEELDERDIHKMLFENDKYSRKIDYFLS